MWILWITWHQNFKEFSPHSVTTGDACCSSRAPSDSTSQCRGCTSQERDAQRTLPRSSQESQQADTTATPRLGHMGCYMPHWTECSPWVLCCQSSWTHCKAGHTWPHTTLPPGVSAKPPQQQGPVWGQTLVSIIRGFGGHAHACVHTCTTSHSALAQLAAGAVQAPGLSLSRLFFQARSEAGAVSAALLFNRVIWKLVKAVQRMARVFFFPRFFKKQPPEEFFLAT